MPILIKIEKVLEDWWGTEKDFGQMTNEQIVELVKEDKTSFTEDAHWTVVRIPVTTNG